jgi:hypothetical protein
LLLLVHPAVHRLYQRGLPVGVTFSFLISSPMVDLGSLVLLMSIFGAKVAVVYVISASSWRSSAAPSSKSCTWSAMWRTSSKTPPAWTSIPESHAARPGVYARDQVGEHL